MRSPWKARYRGEARTSTTPEELSVRDDGPLEREVSWMWPHGYLLATSVLALAVFGPAALFTGGPRDTGDLYVANIGSNEVTRYDGSTGAFEGVFVAAGAGGLHGATGIAFGPDGHLYVGSSQTDQVLRYDGASGAPLGAFVDDSALAMPFSLIFGSDGNLYVSSGRGNVVRRYDGRTGAFLGVAAADSALRQPIGLAFGGDGMLYVVNSAGKNVMRFDPGTGSGAVFASDSMGFPSDLAFGPDGALYVSNASKGTVARFDSKSGAYLDVYARLPERSAPVGLAFTGDGRLFVGDFANSRLFLVPPGGGEPRIVTTEGLLRPENMAVEP